VHHRFVARGAPKNEFHSFFERNPQTAGRVTIVKVVALLVFKSGLQLLEDAPFLVQDEAFELVRLKPPVEDEASCVFVTRPSQGHEGVVVKLVEDFAN